VFKIIELQKDGFAVKLLNLRDGSTRTTTHNKIHRLTLTDLLKLELYPNKLFQKLNGFNPRGLFKKGNNAKLNLMEEENKLNTDEECEEDEGSDDEQEEMSSDEEEVVLAEQTEETNIEKPAYEIEQLKPRYNLRERKIKTNSLKVRKTILKPTPINYSLNMGIVNVLPNSHIEALK
jgi:hypothetical protein